MKRLLLPLFVVALGLGAAAVLTRGSWLPLLPGYATDREIERSRVAAGSNEEESSSNEGSTNAPPRVVTSADQGKTDTGKPTEA